MTTPRYDYYLIENTYVARFNRETGRTERLMPNETWEHRMRTHEILERAAAGEREGGA